MNHDRTHPPYRDGWRAVRTAWGVAGALLLLGWLLSAWVAPWLIRAAYRGESLSWINQLIEGQAVRSVTFYLARWSDIRRNVLAYLAAQLLLTFPLILTFPRIARRLRSDTVVRRRYCSPEDWLWGITAVSLAVALCLFYLKPVAFALFVKEDYWAEWATSFFFSAAVLFLGFGMAIDRDRRRIGYALLALAALFVAGEEFSWGQRVIGFHPPEFFLEHNVQREANLHNLTGNPPSWLVGVAILLWAVAAPWAARRMRRMRAWVDRLGVPMPPRRLRPLFYASAAFLFLSHVPFLIARFTELGELFLGGAVAALALHLALESAARVRPPPIVTTLSTGLLLGMLGLTTWGFVTIVGPPDVSSYLHYYAIDRYPGRGLYRQAEAVFGYLKRHEALMADTTLLEEGRVLLQAGRPARAAEALEQEIARETRTAGKRPEDPAPHRNIMVAHRLLGRDAETAVARQAALVRDSVRLERAKSSSERAEVRWSISVTLEKAGMRAQSLAELAAVCDSLPSGRLARKVSAWMQQSFPEVRPPDSCLDASSIPREEPPP